MPQRTSYAQGTPAWVDVQTPDQAASKAFYGELFGWTFDDRPIPEGGVYSQALRNGLTACAIARQPPDMLAQRTPPTWNTYFAVDNADEVAERVDAAGGKVLMPPFDVMQAGRMAFVADPTGGAAALWQAGDHIGAQIVNEPGALAWNELLTDDPHAAAAFYTTILGIDSYSDSSMGEPYVTLRVDDHEVAGITRLPGLDTPTQWVVYFGVSSTQDTIQKAERLGGRNVRGPIDTPFGPMASLHDPDGGPFSLIQLQSSE